MVLSLALQFSKENRVRTCVEPVRAPINILGFGAIYDYVITNFRSLFGLWFNIQVNIYGHVETVS